MSNGHYSKLSDHGCDFVVATTQASINSNLWEYLAQGTQPVEYIAFVIDRETKLPTVETKLEDLLKITGGVSPFDIPAGTPYSDHRIAALNKARFSVGIKIQMGIPPGCTPENSAPIVILGNDPSKVTLNMYCAQITVIENAKDPWDDDDSRWNVWSQSPGDPWIIQSEVDLVLADLDRDLNNSDYLKKNPAARDQLHRALDNLSGTAFSLQQLLFDLDNAALGNNFSFTGIPDDSKAKPVLEANFLKKYAKSAKDHGWPLVSVTAVAEPKDDSQLQMTAFERIVTPLKDDKGHRIQDPDAIQQSATTLDYLCVVDRHPCPSADTQFDWNWAEPEHLNNSSGVMVINRQVLLSQIVEKLKPEIAARCYDPQINSVGDAVHLSPSQDPLVVDLGDEPSIRHYKEETGIITLLDSAGKPDSWSVLVEAGYDCWIWLYDSHIDVTQKAWGCFWPCGTNDDGTWRKPPTGSPMYQTEMVTTYDLSVDSSGALQITKSKEESTPDSVATTLLNNGPVGNGEAYANLFYRVIRPLVEEEVALHDGELHSFQLSLANNFVFPGGRAFTYKNPRFSKYWDLLCDITYLDITAEDDSTEVSNPSSPEPPSQQPSSPPSQPQPATRTTTGGKLTASTDLMQNYIQGEIVSPTGKFEALQTSEGHALLFAIDPSLGVFHVIQEQAGVSHTGWQVTDLSTAAIQAQFPGQDSSAVTVRTFDVGQRALDGSIGLMMVVHLNDDSHNDHLFISLGNSNEDTSWTSHPTWTAVPFDAELEAGQCWNASVANTFFAETWEQKQYLVVDIGSDRITRYHIDPNPAAGNTHWVKHDVSVDLSAGAYQSAVGRVSGKHGDGIYTAGITGGGQGQLVYGPIVNYAGPGPVSPRRLQLPQGTEIPSAIATARNSDGSTDLYAVAGKALYRLPAEEQAENIEPKLVSTSSIFSGTDTLRAMVHDGVATLWGKNASNQVYYLSCAVSDLWESESRSAPIPILSGVERMSPYINCSDGGNTIFATGDGRLQKLMQGSAATGGIWRPQEIALEVPSRQKAMSFKSYTTSIHVSQTDQDHLPAPNALVNLTATTRSPVYINGLYYVLSTTPIQVPSDASGALTIIETAHNLHGAVITAATDDASITVNPMDQSLAKLTGLDSAEKLRNAQFPSETVAGGVVGEPGSTSLLDSSVDEDTLKAVAQHMSLFQTAYAQLQDSKKNGPPTVPPAAALYKKKTGSTAQGSMCQDAKPGTHPANPGTMTSKALNFGFLDDLGHALDNIGDAIADTAEEIGDDIMHAAEDVGNVIQGVADDIANVVDDVENAVSDTVGNIIHTVGDIADAVGDAIGGAAGDVIQWMKNEGKSIGRIIHDTTTGTLHLVAQIGNKVYHAVLDTAHAVVAGVEWVYNKVKTGVEKLISFIEMLFHWDDIGRSKDVIHNAIKLWMQHEVDYIPNAKADFDQHIDEFNDKMREWSGNVKSSSSSSGASLVQNTAAHGASNPNKDQTPASKMLASHYQNHAGQVTMAADSPESLSGGVEQLINDLMAAVVKEGAVLEGVFNDLKTLMNDFSSLSVEDILKRVAGILADTVLSSVEVVVDALLNVLYDIAQSAITLLDTKIHIPIISDLLNDIGVPDISFLDLICWIAGLSFTVVYKLIEQSAPFPKDDESVQTLLSASSWAELEDAFGASDLSLTPKLPASIRKPFFRACHSIAAFLGMVGNPLSSIEAESEAGTGGMISKGASVIKVVMGGAQSIGDALVPQYPVKNSAIKIVSRITSGLGLLSSLVLSGVAQSGFNAVGFSSLSVGDPRGVGAIVGVVLIMPRLVVAGWHFYELTQDDQGDTLTAAILGEVSNLATYASKILYAVAVNDEDPDTRLIAVTAKAACDDLYAGLQTAETVAGYF